MNTQLMCSKILEKKNNPQTYFTELNILRSLIRIHTNIQKINLRIAVFKAS